jgi:hypothetical protein
MKMIFSLLACALIVLGLTTRTSTAATVSFETAFGSNPLVVSGPTEVFVTKIFDTSPNGVTFRFVDSSNGGFVPMVIIAGTEPIGTTDSFAVSMTGPFLWDVIGGAGVGSGGVLPNGGIFGAFTFGFDTATLDAGRLRVLQGGGELAVFALGLGDTYAALTAPSGGGGGGPSPIPLPAAAWLLLSGFGCLSLLGLRRRSAPA